MHNCKYHRLNITMDIFNKSLYLETSVLTALVRNVANEN